MIMLFILFQAIFMLLMSTINAIFLTGRAKSVIFSQGGEASNVYEPTHPVDFRSYQKIELSRCQIYRRILFISSEENIFIFITVPSGLVNAMVQWYNGWGGRAWEEFVTDAPGLGRVSPLSSIPNTSQDFTRFPTLLEHLFFGCRK